MITPTMALLLGLVIASVLDLGWRRFLALEGKEGLEPELHSKKAMREAIACDGGNDAGGQKLIKDKFVV
nr:hypothetical protein [uncultured Roseococcus sp.]